MAQKAPVDLLDAIRGQMSATGMVESRAADVQNSPNTRRHQVYSVHLDQALDTGLYRNQQQAPGMRLEYTGRIKVSHKLNPKGGGDSLRQALIDVQTVVQHLYKPATDLTTAIDFNVDSWAHDVEGEGEYVITTIRWTAQMSFTLAVPT